MKKKLSILCLLLFFTTLIQGQDTESLFRAYQQAPPAKKATIANQLLKQLKDADEVDTLYHFSAKSRPAEVDFITYSYMGQYYLGHSQYDSAHVACERALARHDKKISDEEYANCLNTMSISLQRLGKFYQALKVQEQCYELDLKSGNKDYISNSLNNLACLYLATKQYEQAEEFVLSSIAIEKELGRDGKLAVRYGTASEIYLKLGDAHKSLQYAHDAYALDHAAHREGKAAIRLSEMASAQIELGQWDKAQESLRAAIPVLERDGNLNSLSICYQQLGLLNLKRGDNATAAESFQKALDISKQTGNIYIQKNAHQGLAQALRDADIAQAYDHLQQYSALSDSMYMEESARLLHQFHSMFHTREVDEKNKQLSTENQMRKQRMRSTTIIFILSVLLLLALLGVLYSILRSKIKANSLMKNHEQMRLDFFTKITHEIRTPLTVIIGQSDNISDGRASSEAEIKSAASIIKRNGIQIQNLANQLLDISRLRSGKDRQEWRRGNIVAYIEMIVESFSSLAIQKGINLSYVPSEEKTDLVFVPDFINKILYNLISNSLKFTNTGGSIMLMSSLRPEGFYIGISDTGVGIDDKDMPHIFEEFYIGKYDSSTIHVGVGLALVKQIVDRLNGQIEVKSTLGKGTSFHIMLPLPTDKEGVLPLQQVAQTTQKAVSDTETTPTDDDAGNPTGPKILVVEDNADVMEFIGSLLKDKYTILYAKNGRDALQVASDQVPDLIISDLMMPEFDGFQLCQSVRATTLLSHIPFIIITAKAGEADRLRAIECGADVYLTKPFNTNELIVRANMLIEQRQQLRERFSQAILNNQETESDNLSATDRAFLQRVDEAVRAQMGIGKADVETMSSILCVSSKQLLRKIYAITGETTVAYILHVRLNEARKMLLEHKDWTVAEVATKCGFDDSAYFTKAFKQQYKMPPSQLRKQASENMEK